MANIEVASPRSPGSLNPFQNSNSNASLAYALGPVLGFIIRLASLVLLLILLVAASVAWIWLYSFRSGWQLLDWLKQPQNTASVAPNLIYGLIVLLVSPIILFAEWSQKIIQRWLNIDYPPKINLRQIIESQLNTKLGESFPFFREGESEKK
ncbi:MAG: hypothetical protein VKK04_19095 [Synechococcales bacterium]|nr:hypothetical protein [Synechococcales bacterium]